MIRSTLNIRGQTTIPSEVRKALRLQPGQVLLYEIRGENVILRAEGESLMDLVGCLKSNRPAVSKESARAAAQQYVAGNMGGFDDLTT